MLLWEWSEAAYLGPAWRPLIHVYHGHVNVYCDPSKYQHRIGISSARTYDPRMSRFENCSTHDISLRLDADFGLARFCSKPTAPSAQITRRSRTVVRGVPSKQRTFRYNPRAGCLSSYESL